MTVSDSQPAVVDSQAFREAMAPSVEMIREFAQAVDDVAVRHGRLPSATSMAMAEIAAERVYAKRSTWGAEPVKSDETAGWRV